MASELTQLAATVAGNDTRDVYGRGGILSEFETELQSLFNKPACLFLPTGTLAQCAVVKCFSEFSGKSGVGLHPTSHLLLHEHNAVESLWGLEIHQFGHPQQVLIAKDVESLEPNKLAAIIVESPMREIGGEMPSWETLCILKEWCERNQVYMHLDGARLWQTLPFYQRDLADIAELFDSIYVSFYKDLGGISGAALLGSETLISEARIWSRRAGGNPVTLYPEALAARAGLKHHLSGMSDYVMFSQALTTKLVEFGFTLMPTVPRAAMFHISFPLSADALTSRICDYAEKTGIVVLPLPRSGTDESCICEVSIGNQALQRTPAFWVDHIIKAIGQE